MNNRFYPYLWYLEYKKIEKLSFDGYIPYFEISLDGFNVGDNAYINLSYLGINLYSGIDNNLCKFYILILAKIRYMALYSRLYLYTKDKDYIISKWKFKSKYIKDRMYIFTSCLKETFASYVIYILKETIYIILDYEKTKENENKIKRIIDEFLPIGIRCIYLFDHFLLADIKEMSYLERWVAF